MLYRSVIGLCGDLGLDVIAEGIESVDRSDMVCRAGGRLAQGHLFSRPVPLPELVESFERSGHLKLARSAPDAPR